MSHPNPSHDPQSEYPSDNYSPVSKKSKHKALSGKIKGFGSEYNRKGIKRLLKKSVKYRLKHF